MFISYSMILKTLCFTLGIVVREECEEKCDESAQVIITNHISMLDYIPIHLLTGCVTVRPFYIFYYKPYNFALKPSVLKLMFLLTMDYFISSLEDGMHHLLGS